MRVIAGSAKGRRLASPKSEKIRPVLDQIKEAVFNILFDVRGLCVLDLFAGTGAMGIEALSRGATTAYFADDDKEAVLLIKKNLGLCGLASQGIVWKVSADKAVKLLEAEGKTFDLIFVDPPYEKNWVNRTLRRLSQSPLLDSKVTIIVEHHPKEPIQTIEGLSLTDQRKYGQTFVTFLKKL